MDYYEMVDATYAERDTDRAAPPPRKPETSKPSGVKPIEMYLGVYNNRAYVVRRFAAGASGQSDLTYLRARNRGAVLAEARRRLSDYNPQFEEWRDGLPDPDPFPPTE